MGDRAFVVFTNGNTVSPLMVLHEHGNEVPALLAEAAAAVARDPAGLGPNVFRIDAPDLYASRFAELCPAPARVRFQSMGEEFETWVRRSVQRDIELVVGGMARLALRKFARKTGVEAGLVLVNVRKAKWWWRGIHGNLGRTPVSLGENGWFEVRKRGVPLCSARAVDISSEPTASRTLPHAAGSDAEAATTAAEVRRILIEVAHEVGELMQ